MPKQQVSQETGLIEEGQLNEIVHVHTIRENGTLRMQTDYRYCPTMAEQHTAHLTDINYLMAKYQPDELAAYIAARGAQRQEIVGHDFSLEPNLQEARNITYKMKKDFEALPEEVRKHFKNHVEFLKFIDNPANAEKMLKLGLMTKREIQKHTDPKLNDKPNDDTVKDQSAKNKPEKT